MNLATEEARTLLERLERLESRTRWLTTLVTVLALFCMALLAWQFGPLEEVVEARSFLLRDPQWRMVAEFRVRIDGTPFLRLRGRSGEERAVLEVRDNGAPALRLLDASGERRAELRLDAEGAPELLLAGGEGRPRAVLAASESAPAGVARLLLRDRTGRTVWTAPPPGVGP